MRTERYNQFNGKCSVYDPYEKLNRKIFVFNSVVDTFLLRPVAKIYGRFTNDYTKNRIGSFIDNISEPVSTVNYTLQGNPEGILKSFWRFAINSTFGIAGIFDVASKFGLKFSLAGGNGGLGMQQLLTRNLEIGYVTSFGINDPASDLIRQNLMINAIKDWGNISDKKVSNINQLLFLPAAVKLA